jgi:uncharacterized protein YdeI (YjbR/CyaY-like superfamily)
MELEFSQQIFDKILKYQISQKFVQSGAELFHANVQTDRHNEANIRFPQFLRTRLKTTPTANIKYFKCFPMHCTAYLIQLARAKYSANRGLNVERAVYLTGWISQCKQDATVHE